MANKEKCKLRYETLKKQGLCTCCAKPNDNNKGSECLDCRNKGRESDRKRRTNLRDKGVCWSCGSLVMAGKTYCEKHFLAGAALRSARRLRLIENGLCPACGIDKPSAQSLECWKCILKKLASRLWHKTSRWIELESLLNKQQQLCPYTGRLLVVGDNASIDHIIALAKGGTNDISNLQWCDEVANYMKRHYSEKEFLQIIDEIAAHTKIKRGQTTI